jgi:small-conductance mechanosensitive channel
MNQLYFRFQKKVALNYLKLVVLFFICVFSSTISFGQQKNNLNNVTAEGAVIVAPVKLDGHTLFNVRGVSSFPAKERAAQFSNRIKMIAANDSISVSSIKIVHNNEYSTISIDGKNIVNIFDADAEIEGISRSIATKAISQKIASSISSYRYNRSKPAILKSFLFAFIASILLVLTLFLLIKISKRINTVLQNRIKAKIDSVENISFNLIKSNQIWKAFHVLFNSIRNILLISIVLIFLEYVLSLFPWTNAFAVNLLNLVVEPILNLGNSFINYIPKFIFLVIIYFITKYVLQLIKLFFSGLESGAIVLKDFHPEWAISTFKIVRTFIIAFAIIIAYPYIPGSDSVAFKGVSVFVGVLFSIGSSGFIGNLIAGYSMIYRGAFRIGDYIEVEGQTGFVEEQQLLITRLRSLKNEEIILPNSTLLNSKIINYTVRAQQNGVILHTVVGIGYETPWRQVDAMLKLAANRTEGLLKDPPPFVQKLLLADYAVNYEINAYCKDINRMKSIYTLLHQNILDVFNENNVQIMTPSYVADTEIPKMVPRDQWDIPLTKEE